MYSIMAGLLIGIGGILNLRLGGIAGAVYFSLGLLAILHFKFELFTGKAGLLATNQITWQKLAGVWGGNFIGTSLAAVGYLFTPQGVETYGNAMTIVANKVAAGPLENLILGVFCGLLMYIAVTGYNETGNAIFVALPVSAFILCGFNHCVADMFYLAMGGVHITDWLILIPITIGNIIGCCAIPVVKSFPN